MLEDHLDFLLENARVLVSLSILVGTLCCLIWHCNHIPVFDRYLGQKPKNNLKVPLKVLMMMGPMISFMML